MATEGRGWAGAGTGGSKGNVSPIRDIRDPWDLNEGAPEVTDYFVGETKSPSFDNVFGKSTEVG